MKLFVVISIFILGCLVSQAQFSDYFLVDHNNSLYSSGDILVGECNGGKLELNYIHNNSITFNIGYFATQKVSCEFPDSYTKSTESSTLINQEYPFRNMENFHIQIGKAINLNTNNTIRIILQGGPGLTTSRSPEFFNNFSSAAGSNYNYQIQASKKLSLVLNPKLEVPLYKMVGFSFGPMLIWNNESNYFGAGIGLIYGIVRNKDSNS